MIRNLHISFFLLPAFLLFPFLLTSAKPSKEPGPSDSSLIFSMLDSSSKYRFSDIARSRKFLEKMLDESEKADFTPGIAYAWMELADISEKRGDHTRAYHDLLTSYENFRNIDDHRGLPKVINSIGTCLANQLRYEEAIDWYYQALALNEKYHNRDLLAENLYNIGIIFTRLEDRSKALYYFNKALQEYSGLGMEEKKGNLYVDMGAIYIVMGNNKQALEYFLKAIDNFEKTGHHNDLYAAVLLRIAKLYYQQGLIPQAFSYCRQSIEISEKLELRSIDCRALAFLAELHKAQGHTQEAISVANEALDLADSTCQLQIAADAHKLLYGIFKSRNNPALALQHLESYINLNDSIRKANDLENLRKLDQKYETAELLKDKAYLEQKAEAARGRILFYVFLMIIILMAALFGFYILYIRNKAARQKYQFARQQMQIVAHEKTVVQDELERKKNELMAFSTLQVKTNESITNVLERLKQSLKITPGGSAGVPDEIIKAIREIDKLVMTDSWAEFRKRFVDIHPGFFENLNKICPSLTSNDLKMASLIRMNLNTKEIASITLKSVESINIAKYRLRKKLQVEDEASLLNFLLSIPSGE